jgi:hypothetical protein
VDIPSREDRRRPLRAAGRPTPNYLKANLSAIHQHIDRTVLLRSTLFTTIALGIGFTTSATSPTGRLAMFAAGMLMGLVAGLRVGLAWPDAGETLRSVLLVSGLVITAADAAIVIGWLV